MIDFNINELLFLNESLAHTIDDQIETIKYLQDKNKKLHCDITDLQAELSDSKNDLQQATNEIKLLNKQIDRHITAVNDLTDIVETSHKIIDDLTEENKELKFRIKMLIKVHLNSVYGLCNVLDNTKETTENDDNN